jgi:hypothetical protein
LKGYVRSGLRIIADAVSALLRVAVTGGKEEKRRVKILTG